MSASNRKPRLLVVTAVDAERSAVGVHPGVRVVVAGIGRTNAAAQTVESVLRDGPFDAVISAGIAGALPVPTGKGGSADRQSRALPIGGIVLASRCVYVEEGLITPAGFVDMRGLGFPLGDFEGNSVPVDGHLLRQFARSLERHPALGAVVGPIATVATCSGTDAAAAEVVERTAAIAEAMEGAAVVHAARRLGVPAIEVRAISNATGDRSKQRWDVPLALRALGAAVGAIVEGLGERGDEQASSGREGG